MDGRICQAKQIVRKWGPPDNKNMRELVADAMCEMEYSAARANGEVAFVLGVLRAYPHIAAIAADDFI